MSKGGSREGAGRPKGATSISKKQQLIDIAVKDGMTPLEYMLKVMRDEEAHPDRRDTMAEKAAQYVHPKLTAISAPNGGPVAMSLEVTFVSPKHQE